MTAYAVAHMRQARMGPQIVEYLQKIDATLAPFGGRFLVHGGDVEVIENKWQGHLIIIEFPDRQQVRGWYNSAAYQSDCCFEKQCVNGAYTGASCNTQSCVP